MRKVVLYIILVQALLAVFTQAATAQETAKGCCGPMFTVTGIEGHFALPKGVVIDGAKEPDIFADQVWGNDLVATVPGLKAGNYSVEIDFAEVYHHAGGKRKMNIDAEGVTLASDYDLFVESGGFAKACRFKAKVTHRGDDLGGALSISLKATVESAMFNAIRIRDSEGILVASVVAKDLQPIDVYGASIVPKIDGPERYKDLSLDPHARAADLISRMSLQEKVNQMSNSAPAIPRLGVAAYNYWNECLHGVGRAGEATVFPQAIGMAATWDTTLIHQVADAISTEARAKYYDAVRHGKHGIYEGLNFWDPNINLFRDPRWGRGQETYGEDPYLTSRLAIEYIRGLQGDDPHYLKVVATAKHFAVHSGPEASRFYFDATPPVRDLYECYLPHFEAAVREGGVWSVMGAYNALNGEPCCSNPFLLQTLLRDQWGFKGFVVSDCWAIPHIYSSHHRVPTQNEAIARAVLAGCDLECGSDYSGLARAVNAKLLKQGDIDVAITRIFEARFRLGMFDPADRVPYSSITIDKNCSAENATLAKRTADESIVLLKNDGTLPLSRAGIHTVAVLGPNMDSVESLVANYHGTPKAPVTILSGLRTKLGDAAEIIPIAGCPYKVWDKKTGDLTDQIVQQASPADVIIFVSGITGLIEGESGEGGDRGTIELPVIQTKLMQALAATGKPIVLVNLSGSAMAMPWEAAHIPAIVQAWYPGQAGGTAVADVLFGDVNPSGRLPITIYNATSDLPKMEDYSMANRTYRYFTGKALWPFGFGLSYTSFGFDHLHVSPEPANPGMVDVNLSVTNNGKRGGDEIVQIYASKPDSKTWRPIRQLSGFARCHLEAGETKTIKVPLRVIDWRYWDEKAARYQVEDGTYQLEIGGSSSDIRLHGSVQVRNGSCVD